MNFVAQKVTDDKELTKIYKLRYKIYVDEWGFEKPENHPNDIETDEYDKNSVHFATRDDTGELIGTIRLIVNPPGKFPIERYCHIELKGNEIPRENLAEISRLAITRNYRNRAEDKYIFGPDEERRSIGSFERYTNKIHYRRFDDIYSKHTLVKKKRTFQHDRRKLPEAIISLYKALYHESKKREITHWYAVMTKGLDIRLGKLGINFQPIGEPVDYHGIRTPYLCEIRKIEEQVSKNNPELYEEFTQDL